MLQIRYRRCLVLVWHFRIQKQLEERNSIRTVGVECPRLFVFVFFNARERFMCTMNNNPIPFQGS